MVKGKEAKGKTQAPELSKRMKKLKDTKVLLPPLNNRNEKKVDFAILTGEGSTELGPL